MVSAVVLGLLYSIMALGVYLTFRILEFADLTVDGSFTTGAALGAVAILNGIPAWVAVVIAFVGGLVAGTVTGLLNTKGNIDGLLAGILTQIALYSINLQIMGRPNLSLRGHKTLFSGMFDSGLIMTWRGPLILLPIAAVIVVLIIWFLKTNLGLAMRATGDNPEMIRSFGVSTDAQKILGLALSNGMVAVSGALIAQYQGYTDASMGIGMIVAGLASVIIGQAIFGRLTIVRAASAVLVGSVLYRVVIQLALEAGLNPNYMKLISAVLVVLALIIPQWKIFKRVPNEFRPRNKKQQEEALEPSAAIVGRSSAETSGEDA